MEKKQYKGIIFDLDGVICHTDELHYQAWKAISDRLGINFNREINHRLRGVSRMESLKLILETSGKFYGESERAELAEEKNRIYVKLLDSISPADLSTDVKITLKKLKNMGIKRAIGSSSKNAVKILERLQITSYFHVVSDGNQIVYSKPDPEVFLLAAERLELAPEECLVVEDAKAGIQAGISGGFDTVAIGDASRCDMSTYKINLLSDILTILERGD